MTIPRLFHSLTAIILPTSGPVAPAEYLPGMRPQMPHGLVVHLDASGTTVERVYAYGWSVLPTNASPQTADVNHDGFVTGEDADWFRIRFESGDATADFNGDGFVTGEDFDEFMGAFQAGFVIR